MISRSTRLSSQKSFGFTLLEILVGIGMLSVLATVAMSTYSEYIERTNINISIKDLMAIELEIDSYALNNNGAFPPDLASIRLSGYLDPWGNPYQYFNVAQARSIGRARKDRNLVPINSDFDLYSRGPDGASVAPLTAQMSRDDIVRANNGRFFGIAEDY